MLIKGISTPTIDGIFNLFNFDNQVLRLPFFGYGCSGGVLGLNRAVEVYKNIKNRFWSVMLNYVV